MSDILSAVMVELEGLVASDWSTEQNDAADRVELCRNYVDGAHRAELTQEMQNLLRISGDALDQFNANYCDMVVSTMTSRLIVERVEPTGDDEAQGWVDDLLANNRFDALQMDIHEAALTDGDTYLLVSFDQEAGRAVLSHEPAYDGAEGMIVVYDSTRRYIMAAVKIWQEAADDTNRVNIYYPGVIYKFTWGDGRLTPMSEPLPWVDRAGRPLGVPVVHFRNRGRKRRAMGLSEVAKVIPLQDALNRTLTSMVMTSELSAFQIRVAKGFTPPEGLAPGMWLSLLPDAGEGDEALLSSLDAYALAQGELVPFIQEADFLIDKIGMITNTPLPTRGGSDNQSGEALKMRESGLLGKVRDFQIRAGNSWENAVYLAHYLAGVYGAQLPPGIERLTTVWRPAGIRDDATAIKNIMAIREFISERELLRLVAPIFNYDDDKIEKILAERASETRFNLQTLGGSLPGFDQFQL